MTALATLLALDDSDQEPIFHVEPPDGVRDWSEIARQRKFLNLLTYCAPDVFVFARPNAGKRNPRLARLEGIKAGGFDVECVWNHGRADIEFKGYSGGQANRITHKDNAAQVRWGNRMTRLGHRVACFFDPFAAAMWLAEQGAPVDLKVLEGLRK